MSKLTELLNEYDQSYTKLKDNVLKILQNIAKKDNVAIVLSGYYPYFNDGDLCEYSGSVYIYSSPNMQELCDLAEHTDLEYNYHYSEDCLIVDGKAYVDKDWESMEIKYSEVFKLKDYRHILQSITGNNADVIITPDKVQVWETEPY